MLRDICLLYFEIGYIIVHQLRVQSLSRRYHLRSKQEKENRNLRSKKKKRTKYQVPTMYKCCD